MYGPDEKGNLANFSAVELVSLPETLVGCPRLCDVVPESLRHYLENIHSMIKSKAELENMQHPLAANWDPVLKRNRAKKNAAVCTFAGDWSSSASSEGNCEIFFRNFYANRKGKKQKRLVLDARIVNWAFVSQPE